MARKKKVELGFLDDSLKKTQTPVVEQSATIETKEDELKETKWLVVRISKELEKRILNSSLHNQKSVHAALPKLVRLGLDSENEFIPKMDRKFSGAFVPFNTPSDFDKTYQNTVKSKMLTNNKSAFTVEMIEWVLDGCPKIEHTTDYQELSEDELLGQVIKKCVLITSYRQNTHVSTIMKQCGKQASDFTRIEVKKTVALINLAKAFNAANLGLTINIKKETVAINFGENEKGLHGFDVFLEWKAFD